MRGGKALGDVGAGRVQHEARGASALAARRAIAARPRQATAHHRLRPAIDDQLRRPETIEVEGVVQRIVEASPYLGIIDRRLSSNDDGADLTVAALLPLGILGRVVWFGGRGIIEGNVGLVERGQLGAARLGCWVLFRGKSALDLIQQLVDLAALLLRRLRVPVQRLMALEIAIEHHLGIGEMGRIPRGVPGHELPVGHAAHELVAKVVVTLRLRELEHGMPPQLDRFAIGPDGISSFAVAIDLTGAGLARRAGVSSARGAPGQAQDQQCPNPSPHRRS